MKTCLISSFVCLAFFTLGAQGCSQEMGEDVAESDQALGTTIDVPNPSGAYFASVTANGSGCPAGTWDAAISPDGAAFTVTFSAYEALVNPGSAMAVKDCTLGIKLKTPEGFSFSVSSFHYQGYALLDKPGMSARQTAKYYFMGNPVPAQELRSDMTGPYDDSYVFSDQIGVTDLVWSPCGAERTLNAQTRLVLQNNPQKTGSGYLNTSSVDGEVKTVLRFGLTWKQCGSNPPAGSWHQAEGQDCGSFCASRGMSNVASPEGHKCTSGELIPASAVGKISYRKGCWPNCQPHGAPRGQSLRKMCYGDGQRRDNDRTDQTMGCFCR